MGVCWFAIALRPSALPALLDGWSGENRIVLDWLAATTLCRLDLKVVLGADSLSTYNFSGWKLEGALLRSNSLASFVLT
jgi:hypothetical protein